VRVAGRNALSVVVNNAGEGASAFLFLPWIPQLLGGLSRGVEAEACKHAQTVLSVAYPQALYYPPARHAAGQGRHPRTYLRRCHTPAYDMNTVEGELFARANRFSLEEEMLSFVMALLAGASVALQCVVQAVELKTAGKAPPAPVREGSHEPQRRRADFQGRRREVHQPTPPYSPPFSRVRERDKETVFLFC
jgi:hypothetical protein